MDRAARGREAEDSACAYLQARGLQLLTRNYRTRQGEIDLILADADSLVFVEVRYRAHARFGSAAESVDRRKQARLLACARHYLLTHPQAGGRPCRFDVVAVNGERSIEWIPNAFTAVE